MVGSCLSVRQSRGPSPFPAGWLASRFLALSSRGVGQTFSSNPKVRIDSDVQRPTQATVVFVEGGGEAVHPPVPRGRSFPQHPTVLLRRLRGVADNEFEAAAGNEGVEVTGRACQVGRAHPAHQSGLDLVAVSAACRETRVKPSDKAKGETMRQATELFFKRRRYRRRLRQMLRDLQLDAETRTQLEACYRRGWQPRRVP